MYVERILYLTLDSWIMACTAHCRKHCTVDSTAPVALGLHCYFFPPSFNFVIPFCIKTILLSLSSEFPSLQHLAPDQRECNMSDGSAGSMLPLPHLPRPNEYSSLTEPTSTPVQGKVSNGKHQHSTSLLLLSFFFKDQISFFYYSI